MLRYLLDTNVGSEPEKSEPTESVLSRLRWPTAVAEGQVAAMAGAEGPTAVTENTSDDEPFANLPEKAGVEAGIHLVNWLDGEPPGEPGMNREAVGREGD